MTGDGPSPGPEDAVGLNPERVPDELRAGDHWLLWDSSADSPRRPHWRGDFSVGWTDPEDLHTFDDAVEAAGERDSWGIGYVFSKGSETINGEHGAIDIDGCVSEQGSKDWLPSLQPFFDRNAYMEYSPSGEGIHIPIVDFEPPEWWSDSHMAGREHEGVEAYGKKFFTVTGDALRNTGDEPVQNGEFVERWLEQVHKSLNGEDPPRENHESGNKTPIASKGSDSDWFDADVCEQALESINPDVAYPMWRDIGFALADEFDDSKALSLFKEWSQDGVKWDRDAKKQAESIITNASEGGGRTIATVIHYAKESGWTPPAPSKGSPSTQSGVPTNAFADTDPDDSSLDPLLVRAAAGLGENDEISDLTDREKAATVWMLIKDDGDVHVRVRRDNDSLWSYDDGIWKPQGERALRYAARRALGPMEYGNNVLTELKTQARSDPCVEADEFGLSPGTVAVENGLVDLKEAADGAGDDALRELRPDDYALTQLPVEYDPTAEYDEWASYVEEWAEDGKADALQEYVGYCLHIGAIPIHRALLLVGSGANGKGTFLAVVRALLGQENTSAIELQTLANERYAVADFYGALANIDDDLSSRKLGQGLGMFKKLVAGDRVRARRLYEDGFEFDPTAKQLYAANEVPDVSVSDEDAAFWRRWLLVEFPNYYPPAERDPELRDRLTDPDGLSGVLNWAVEGWRRLLDQGRFTNEERLDHDKRTRWQSWGDSVDRFISECVEHDPDADRLSTRDAYRRYEDWCHENEEEPVGQRNFTNTLKDGNVGYGKHRIDGTSTLGYTELGFSDDVPGHGDEKKDSESSLFPINDEDI